MSRVPLFHRAYGNALDALPAPIRDLHDVQGERRFEGRASVARGTTWMARLTCWIMRFPPDMTDRPLTLGIHAGAQGEVWSRSFDGTALRSRLSAGPDSDTVVERLCAVAATSRLLPDLTGVTQVLMGIHILGLPVPRALWPELDVREGTEGDRYTFRMRIEDPWGRLVIAYRGWLKPVERLPRE